MFKKEKNNFFSLILSFIVLVFISLPSIVRILSRKYMGFSRYMVVKNRYLDEILPMNTIGIFIALIVVIGILFSIHYYRNFKNKHNGDIHKTYVSYRLYLITQILIGVTLILYIFTQSITDTKTLYIEILSYLIVYIITLIVNIRNFRVKD